MDHMADLVNDTAAQLVDTETILSWVSPGIVSVSVPQPEELVDVFIALLMTCEPSQSR